MQKTKFPTFLATFLLCYGFWILLTWSFSAQELIAGAVVCAAVALFSARIFIHDQAFWFLNPKRFGALIAYIGVFLGELWKANVDMARRCFGGCKDIDPGIVRVPVELKGDYARAMLANSITLTPGTITLDIAEDKQGRNWYYIHWIDMTTENESEAGEIIKGRMEKALRRVWDE